MRATAVTFSRTMRSIQADRSHISLPAVLLLAAILGLWLAWLALARVAIYAVSETARIETSSPTVAIQSVYAGRISENDLVLGRKVKRGDILAAIDANLQRLQLKEEASQGGSIGSQIAELRNQIAAEQRTMEEEERAARIGLDEARARLKEASATAAYASVEVERKSTLDREGLSPRSELAQARSQEEKSKANVEGLRLAIGRLERELQARKGEREAHIRELRRQVNQLSGSSMRLQAMVDRLKTEVELRQIVAPVEGTIGEVANLPLGSVVSAGQRLGAIVPDEGLKVVAQFDPAKAVGRIRQGQEARVRLQGFPWTQYGTVGAIVTRVANEVQDGHVRVELTPGSEPPIPLQHGLPGTTEIAVERISPASLLLRLAGQTLTSQNKASQNRTSPTHFNDGATAPTGGRPQ